MDKNPKTIQDYESLIQNHDNELNWIIKEINELSDFNKNNDNIESNVIVNNELNEWLKWYLENNKDIAITLINKINSIKTDNLSNKTKQDLQNLVRLISSVINWTVEWTETEKVDLPFRNLTELANISFNKLEELIKANKDLGLLNDEFQNIMEFISDDKNNIRTLSLYAKMLPLSEKYQGNREVFDRISNAIRSHFNITWSDAETTKKLRLSEIFKDKNSKSDLTELYKEYIWNNWNWNSLSNNWNFKKGTELTFSYKDFAKEFNNKFKEINNKNIDKNNIGKNMTVERVNSINKFVNNIMWSDSNEFLNFEGENLKYSIEKVKKFLSSINKNNFNRIKRDGKYARISAVQIFLNEKYGKNLVIDGEYSNWCSTYLAILDFQKEYNKKYNDKLKEDWVPGPKTLNKLLWANGNNAWQIEWIDTSKFDDYELRILRINSENFYEWYNYTKEEIEAHHRYKRWRIIENIESYTQKVITEKREIRRREITESIRSDLVTLPIKEKADIILWIHKVVEKFNIIHKYLDFKNWPYRSPKALLCAMRWINDNKIISRITDNITVRQHWVWLMFFVWDETSYNWIYHRTSWNDTWSGWFNHARSAIKELRWTLSVVNWKDPGTNTRDYKYRTIRHEGQHNRNQYFMPDVDKSPIAYAKDEITAYLREWKRTIEEIEQWLTKDESKWWLYQYGLRWQARENHKKRVRELLWYAGELIALTKKNIWLTRDNVISMLSDTPEKWWKDMYDKIMKSVNNGSNLHEFWRAWTTKKQTEINEINHAKSIEEIKHILNDPKYSHISRWPDNMWWLEVSAIIDEVISWTTSIQYIPSEIRHQIQRLIKK